MEENPLEKKQPEAQYVPEMGKTLEDTALRKRKDGIPMSEDEQSAYDQMLNEAEDENYKESEKSEVKIEEGKLRRDVINKIKARKH